jgi:hypothetical protein
MQPDQNVGPAVNQRLKVHDRPMKCHHRSWRDSGLS